MHDIFDGGLQDYKFSLLYNANRHVDIVVKTPVGRSDPGTIKNAITQGDVFGPLLYSKQVDTFGKKCL